MKVHLLYKDKELTGAVSYYDTKSIIQDLNLTTILSAASKDIELNDSQVVGVKKENKHIFDIMKRVLMTPLTSESELKYRHQIIKDIYLREQFIIDLYNLAQETENSWDRLGRKDKTKSSNGNPVAFLIQQIQTIHLFLDQLHKLKVLFAEYDMRLTSDGLCTLSQNLIAEFSDEIEEQYRSILEDIAFYTDVDEEYEDYDARIKVPRISFQIGISNGLKLTDIRLESLQSVQQRVYSRNGAISKLQKAVNTLTPNVINTQKNADLGEQAEMLEYQAVQYVVNCFDDFMIQTGRFFDQLYFQTAFYRGALNLKHHFQRYHLEYCYPKVASVYKLQFTDLKDLAMCMEQRIDAIGNDTLIEKEDLLVITGANQGGKSTYLRSIGIAQIMMQAGLIVAAKDFEAKLYPNFFTHFTRREDSAMNSGRLDEELKRISLIIDHIGPNSILLLNESFASTTEKEGSVIAYDVVKALLEQKVSILTVTHLLSFAKKIYTENKESKTAFANFLCAERLSNGQRTYKMIPHEPELTSFGLDLYDEIIKGKGK